MHPILLNRPQSGFPVSIGTGLALETLFTPIQEVYDETRQVNNLPDLSVYSIYIFNISTLLRNLISSIKYKDLITIPKKDILETLLEEIDFLTNFFINNDVTIKFYINNYNFVKETYKDGDKLRKATTDKQIIIDNIFSYCLDKIKKEDDVELFTKDIKYDRTDRGLIFTHVPFDLLSYNNFIKLDLLESHTGIIKTRKDWNTKYYPIPNKDMSFLPFMEYLLVCFGDHVMFKPDPLDKRLKVYEAMKKKGVNPLTSELSFSFLFGETLLESSNANKTNTR